MAELKTTEQWFLDWQEHPRAVGNDLRSALNGKIDTLIAAEQQKIKTLCQKSLEALKAVREANTVRLQQNDGAQSTAKLVGLLLIVLVLATALLALREIVKMWFSVEVITAQALRPDADLGELATHYCTGALASFDDLISNVE